MQLFSRKPRVLVLDDDLSMQKLVSLLLKRKGYRVDVVSTGREAIESIGRHEYTAILLDLMMPHEGGMTVLSHLRAKNPATLQHVILLTGMPDSVLKGIAKDVFAVVRKPFEASELLATVERLS